MKKLTRYSSFDDLKASNKYDKSVDVSQKVKAEELEGFFSLLRAHLVKKEFKSGAAVDGK